MRARERHSVWPLDCGQHQLPGSPATAHDGPLRMALGGLMMVGEVGATGAVELVVVMITVLVVVVATVVVVVVDTCGLTPIGADWWRMPAPPAS